MPWRVVPAHRPVTTGHSLVGSGEWERGGRLTSPGFAQESNHLFFPLTIIQAFTLSYFTTPTDIFSLNFLFRNFLIPSLIFTCVYFNRSLGSIQKKTFLFKINLMIFLVTPAPIFNSTIVVVPLFILITWNFRVTFSTMPTSKLITKSCGSIFLFSFHH